MKVAEKLIETNDKARAEVVVDVELLQVNTQKLHDLGLSLSSYSIGQQLGSGLDSDNAAAGTQLGLNDLRFLNRGSWTLTIPSFVYNFVKTNSQAQVLAKPQLRISEGEKAALLIGDRVPIPTTTFNTSNTVGSNIVPITSFQYQDVGIKINIEPRVHHNLEVTLKMHVEVSNRLRLEGDLRHALAGGGLSVAFQPLLDLASSPACCAPTRRRGTPACRASPTCRSSAACFRTTRATRRAPTSSSP